MIQRRNTRPSLRTFALAVAAASLPCCIVQAQTITATVRGVVTDTSGAVIGGATVVARNDATGVLTRTITNTKGSYNIQFLPIGQYTVEVTRTGFQKIDIGPFALSIDQIAKVDAKLPVGDTATSVNVSAATAPLLQTQDATLGTTISGETLRNLPNNGLNFQFATLFVPGAVLPTVSSLAGSDGNERNTDWYGTPSFNGNRGQDNNYILDGVEINETLNNYAGYNPAPDALGQVRIITGNANAEYGNVGGGEVLMVTRSGTNHYHGSLYEFYQSNTLAANSWANNFAGIALNPFTQNQFGATLGGPIRRNKLFFFGDYEGFRYHSGGTGAATVATAAMRTGDFSELLGSQYGKVQLYNNQLGQGFANATAYANNQIPINNPVAKFLFSHPNVYPLPNAAPLPGLGDMDNYRGATKSQSENNQGDVRIDYSMSSRDSIIGRFTYGDALDFQPSSVIPVFFPNSNDFPFLNSMVGWVHIFSSSAVNNFRAGYSRTVYTQAVPSDPSGVFGDGGNTLVGIPFVGQAYAGFSQMNFASFESNVGTTALVNLFHENNFFYGDDFSLERGNHNIKIGVQILRYQQNSFYPGNAGALGSFAYSGQYTANPNVEQLGYGFADFVLDQSSDARVGGVAGPTGQRQYRSAAYVQDDWRATQHLTLNLGLRYGYDQPIYEVHNREANLVNSYLENPNPMALSSSVIQYAGVDGASRALYDPYPWQFMPRFGFAMELTHRAVLRGAYGISDDLEGTGTNLRLTQNPPFLFQFGVSPTPPTAGSDGAAPLRVENGFQLSSSNVTTNTTQFNAYPANLRPALIQQFNLTTQFLLSEHTTAQVAYVGNLGHHLTVPIQANQYSTPATGILANGDCSGALAPAAPFCSLVGNYGNLYITNTEGYSNYNALQATLHHELSMGFVGTINYTWSKGLTNNAGFYGVGGVAESSSFFQNIYDPAGDYGPIGEDTRNAINANGIFSLPFGAGRRYGSTWNTATDAALGGWQISGDAVLYSGFPLTMYSNENYFVNANGVHSIHFRPLHIVHRTTQNWFGTDPSASPCLSADANGNTIDNGTCAYGEESFTGFGNAQNGSERAPGFRQIDLAVFKTFHLLESQTLELRGEGFNAFNLASYGAPDSSLADAATSRLGLISSTLSTQRILQVSLHYRF